MTHDQWVQMHLKQMRAERRQRRTLILGAGGKNRARLIDEKGERILYGPYGQAVRVIEWEGGNQVEEDEHLHAVIRPAARFKLAAGSAVDESGSR
jgi:hypothetical protein